MDFRVLGPLEVVDGSEVVPVPGAKQGALLAMLLLHANEIVSSSRLLEELWADAPPSSGMTALQVRVSQLRKALGTAGDAIVTRPPGYVLQIAADQLDLHRFERLLGDADRALQRDEAATAWARLEEALALWRGPALTDFAYESFAQAAIGRLEELRIVAQELRVDAGLRLGHHAELVGELEALVSQHALRERLRGQLMLALYRSGRQAEALEAYQAARRTLVEELGIEPMHELQELEGAILRQERELDLPRSSVTNRSLLVAAIADRPLAPLLAAAEPLARHQARELIVSRLVGDRGGLAAASVEMAEACALLVGRDIVARAAAFTSESPGMDVARLAREQDVDLVAVTASPALLDDPELATLLATAPCDVALVLGEPVQGPGPVLVPFTGGEHDWSAIELGAWFAVSWHARLRLAGPAAEGRKDSSRLLASASLAVQRALGVAAEPLLLEPDPARLVDAAAGAAVAVVGLPEGWRRTGLGATRAALAASGRPTVLVRKGLRPGGLAPPENLTRFTWSLRAS
jgi:DNA-binding SARP family transcriptional activator